MKSWVKGHQKIIILCGVLLIALIAWMSVRQREAFKKNSIGNTMANPIRREAAFTDTFYFEQLTEKEIKAYEILKGALDDYVGGEVVFPEPLTGKEFTRVCNALEYGAEDYFYGMVGIPMDEKNRNLSYKNSNILDLKEPEVAKCILFMYCAEGINQNGDMDEEGYVTNLEELKKPLSTVNMERMKEIQTVQEKRDQVLNQVINGLPKEYGAKEAMDYFLNWMDENLTLQQASEESQGITEMTDFFSKINFKSHMACLAEKNAFASGYARVFCELCNRAGIEAHLVMGVWSSGFMGSSQESYILTCVAIDGENIYVDASGTHKKQLLDQRYIKEEGARNWMEFVDYFDYE